MIFISNVGSFLTGISTTALISTIDPYGEEGYLFLIPFTLMKALIAAIIGVVMVVFVRRTMIEVFNILSHKMGRYVPIPFIASFGFFCIVQIVQAVGLPVSYTHLDVYKRQSLHTYPLHRSSGP